MLSETIKRKYQETFDVSDYEVFSDNGWVDIKSIGLTIPYIKYTIKTKNFELSCADDHIVFDENLNEVFVKDLKLTDKIQTLNGCEEIISYIHTEEKVSMYDLNVAGEHKYYTNGILSHNSIWLANLTANAVKNGFNSAFITFEMGDRDVVKRIGANLLNESIKTYDDFSKNVERLKARLQNIGNNPINFNKRGELYIKEYPTSASSVKDVENWLVKMEEKKQIKFKIIFVDYINIMLNWRNPNTENTYMKIKQIAEDLRAMGQRNDWAIVSLSQISKNGFDTSGRLSIKDVAESSGLGHTVDWMGGIIQDPFMHANNEYLLQTMLNRNGGFMNTRKKFNVNYEYMKISEDLASDIIESK